MSFEYERSEFDLDEVTFQFKKSSPKNFRAVMEYQAQLVQEFEDIEEPEDVDDDADIQSMKNMVELIAEPVNFDTFEEAAEEVSWMEVDRRKVQEAMNYFLT